MKVDLLALSRPIKAKSVALDNGVVLSFSTPDDDNEVSVFLPDHMKACVAMIVEAFNAHMKGDVPATGEPTDYYVGLHDPWAKVNAYKPVEYKTGGAIKSDRIARLKNASDIARKTGEWDLTADELLAKYPDGLIVTAWGAGGGPHGQETSFGPKSYDGVLADRIHEELGDTPLPTGSSLRTADAINLAQGWAALTDDDAMEAVERRDLP